MKKRFILYLASFVFIFPVLSVHGAVFSANKDSYVLNSEVSLLENLYAASDSVSLLGKLVGDAFLAGRIILVDGDVRGDLFLAGESINIKSPVVGDVRVVGKEVIVASSTDGDLVSFGESVRTTEGSTVTGDTVIFAETIELRGIFDKDVIVNGADVTIAGTIKGDLKVKAGQLRVLKDAVVSGTLSYSSPEIAHIEDGANIKAVDFKEVRGVYDFKQRIWLMVAIVFIFKFLVILMSALVLFYSFRRFAEASSLEAVERPGKSLFVGFAMFVLIPVLALISIFSLIGGFLGLGLMLFYLVLLYVAKILSSIVIGVWVFALFGRDHSVLEYLSWKSIVLGVFVSGMLLFIPIIGLVLNLIAVLVSMGIIGEMFYRKVWVNR